jgi:hypothetical protein
VALVIPERAPSKVLFHSSRRLLVLEHFGVPYEVVDSHPCPTRAVERVEALGDRPALLWPSESVLQEPPQLGSLGLGTDREIPLFARMINDAQAQALLAEQGGSWVRTGAVLGPDGTDLASIWRGEDSSIFLPFDPDEVRLNYLSERYRFASRDPGKRDWHRLTVQSYYRVRPLLPRSVQIWLRRRYAPFQAHARFPRWPAETGLHDFMDFILGLAQSLAGEPVPTIAPWPNGSSWALVLTHDVESASGFAAMDRVMDLERSLGLRSSWNLVPRRDYEVAIERVDALVSDGFEVGVHGLYHDGRDLESMATLRERLPGMREAATRWRAVGFRSPATQRNWDLMPVLGFDYDGSFPDSDPFEPQGGGCCTWQPFFIHDTVELPLTMTQDHTLFVILRRSDEQLWVEKAEFLRRRAGLVLLDTHPDYLIDETVFRAYQRLLERYANDNDAWKALPAEVSNWWRRRAASRLERADGEWLVTGPAAQDARVEFVPSDTDWLGAFEGLDVDAR